MTRDEALDLLGVDGDSSPEVIRRAYLRQLRGCRPDDDPHAFMRLREAFETASAAPTPFPAGWDLDARRGAGRAAATAQGTHAEDGAELPEFRPVPEAEPSGTAADAELITPYLRRLQLLPAEDSESRLEIARQAVAEHPGSTVAHWLLVRALEAAGRSAEVPPLLRACRERGMPGFFQELVEAYPQELTDSERDELVGSGDPGALASLAIGYLRQDQHERSRETLDRALDLVAESDRVRPGAVAMILTAVLRFQAAGDVATAREALSRFSQVAQVHGGELSLLATSEDLTLWYFAKDLDALPENFPASVRSAIARAVAAGDPTSAVDELQSIVLDRLHVATKAADMMRGSDLLMHFYHHILSGPHSTSYSGIPQRAGIPVGLLLVLTFWIVRSDACSSRRHEPSPVFEQFMQERRSEAEQAMVPAGRRIMEAHCQQVPQVEVCTLAATFIDQVSEGDCDSAAETLEEVRQAASDGVFCPGGGPCITLTSFVVERYLDPLLLVCRPAVGARAP